MFPITIIKLFLIVSIIITQSNQSSSKSLKLKPRIYKGTAAKENQFPWISYLRVFPPEDDYFTECGGTLIDERHLLTAAHCLYIDAETLAQPADIYSLLNITEEPWPMRNPNPTELYYIHPEFNISADWIMAHDLAIIRLSSPVTIEPICIHKGDNLTDNQELTAAGFGTIDGSDEDDNYYLNYVKVNYLTRDECESERQSFVDRQLTSKKMDPNQVPELLETQFCAINQQTRGDTCPGDSGGPLIYSDSLGDSLVGLVTGSWTKCGSPDVPGIYTWVAKYLDWIKSKGVKPCEK